jgi:hypothetical protein
MPQSSISKPQTRTSSHHHGCITRSGLAAFEATAPVTQTILGAAAVLSGFVLPNSASALRLRAPSCLRLVESFDGSRAPRQRAAFVTLKPCALQGLRPGLRCVVDPQGPFLQVLGRWREIVEEFLDYRGSFKARLGLSDLLYELPLHVRRPWRCRLFDGGTASIAGLLLPMLGD